MKELKTIEEWNDVVDESNDHPILVIKHSTTCPISAAGYKAFQSFETNLPKYCVIVQTSKDVSQKIAEDVQLKHESPQAILLKNKKAVWNASHYDINESNLEKAVTTE